MGSYSDWITGRRNTYKTAITNAYNAHVASSGNDYETAYDAMNADSDVRVLIPPQNNTAFYGSSPNATEAQINTLQTWLQANPAQAGRLNLAAESTASDDTIRKALGGAGNVGSERRRWKGNPLYTFANGIVVGKDNKLIAGIGTDGGNSIDGFGTDTLIYFDGIPFSKGTGLPGTSVFAGDLVVSGSIQGTGGIVIIDDVIQLERGVSNPAGIGVDDSGKIRLRHRGQGFLDLVDEVEKAKSGSIEDAKLWVGTQNTNSARWGNSLIPNSNFSLIRAEGSYTNGNYVERPAGVISAGTTSEIVTLTDGIATFAANGQGIIMQAIPIDCERYTVRIRYKGSTAVTPTGNNQAQGIFLAFHETTDDDATIDGKSFIYDNSTPATNTSDNSNVHTGNVTVKYPTSLRSTDNSTHDGAPIPTSYTIRSYTYEPTAGTKNASLVIHASNYGSGTLDIDYVVLTENPKTTTEINNLITTVTDSIQGETGSDIPDAQMTDKANWAAIGGASLANNANGGDGGTGDAAIEVTTSGSGQGITSSAVDTVSDRYLVGIRIKTTSGTTNISIDGVETAGPFYGTLGGDPPKLAPGASDYRTKAINIDTINGAGQPSGAPASTKSVGTSWTTLVGTYEPNKLNPSSFAIGYSTPTGGPAHVLPGKFSLAIRASSACTFVVDYVFAAVQTASVNLAQELANQSYGDSQTFVTAINDLLIKESGSIITNASMALPSSDSNGPAGYRARGTNAVIATVTDSEGDKQVKVTSSESEGVDRVLISPPFALGAADKFSIGARCKSLEGGDVDVSIAIALTDQTSLPSGKVTYAASGGSDVYTSGVTESQLTIDDVSNTQGGDSSLADKYDWAVGTSDYENVVGTFQRKAVDSSYSKKSASVVITANGDFEVDYIFVKEQICSFDLAETTAEDKRDEAIAQATGALQGMTNSLGQESGSLLANASFGSYVYDGSTYQIPKNWAKTRSTTRIHRVVGSTEAVTQGSQTVTPPGEQVAAISQVGACALVTTGGNVNGILSSYFSLPYNNSTTNTGLGKYTVGLRLRVSANETVGIRILAHEAHSPPTGSQEFILCTSSGETAFDTGTTRASTIHSDDSSKTYTVTAGSTGSTAQISLINISQDDTDVGYLSDDFIEYFPVDNAPDTQGDTDATVQNAGQWYSVAGTYTPSSSAQYVSFEIIIEDQDTTDSARANLYIDYVSFVAQTVDADFASTIATARTEDAIDNVEDDPPQVGELMANASFTSGNKTQAAGRPKQWMPYEYASNPPFSLLSFSNNTLKRGMKISGSSGSAAGVISRPFRTSSDDYEIKVKAKAESGDNDVRLYVWVVEYNADITEDIEAIVVQESDVPSTKTVSGGQVVLGNVGTGKVTLQRQGTSDNYQVLTQSYQTFTYEYVPNDATRYASVIVRTSYLDSDKHMHLGFVKCSVDNTASGNRLFAPFRGKLLNQLDLTSFGDTTNLRTSIGTNSARSLIFNNKFAFPVEETYGSNELSNGTFKEARDIHSLTYGRPSGFAIVNYIGSEDGVRHSLEDSWPYGGSFSSGWLEDMQDAWGDTWTSVHDFTGDNRFSFTDATQSQVHLKSGGLVVARGIPVEGGKKYRVKIRAKMIGPAGEGNSPYQYLSAARIGDFSTYCPSNTYFDASGLAAYACHPSDANERVQLTIPLSNSSSGPGNWWPNDMKISSESFSSTPLDIPSSAFWSSTSQNANSPRHPKWYGYMQVGIMYLTTEPAEDVNYLVPYGTQGSGTCDDPDAVIATTAGVTYGDWINVGDSSSAANFRNFYSTFTLPDNAVFGCLFLRRAPSLEGSGYPTWWQFGNQNAFLYPVIQEIAMQKSTGIAVSSFKSLFEHGSGTATFTINSTARSLWNTSDERLKTNIETIPSGLSVLKNLRPVSFNWKESDEFSDNSQSPEKSEIPQYGFIAQEVAEHLPEIIVENVRNFGSGSFPMVGNQTQSYWGMAITQIVPFLTKAIQEQQEIIESQREDIDDLKELVNKLIEDKGADDGDTN